MDAPRELKDLPGPRGWPLVGLNRLDDGEDVLR